MQLKQWTLKSQITCDIMIFHQPLSLGLADIKLEIRCQVKTDQKEKKKKKSLQLIEISYSKQGKLGHIQIKLGP